MGNAQKVKLVRNEAFRIPRLPKGQDICDLYTFPVGKSLFLVITTLCSDRTKSGITQFFHLPSQLNEQPPTLDPLFTMDLYHPRNIAVGPEFNGGRWLWIADHGLDAPPFPGGKCPLFWISRTGTISKKEDPLLDQLAFSFDGCIWHDPKTEHCFLYQSNIGMQSPRLLRWKNKDAPVEDLSANLPKNLLNRRDRFLVSRLISMNSQGVHIFLGGDYSCPSQFPLERDAILKISFEGAAELLPNATPPRLKNKTWSTVEAIPFETSISPKRSLLALTHDFGFKEGFAEVLKITKAQMLERDEIALPIPSLEGKKTWISRAAIGDWNGENRADIILYLRSTDGPMPESQNNLVLLKQNGKGQFERIECTARGFDTHFVGGFFVDQNFFQMRYDGVVEATSFEPTT